MVEVHNEPFKEECQRCGEVVTDINTYWYKHKNNDACMQLTCHKCGKVVQGSHSLKNHIERVHENMFSHMCSYTGCHKKFKTQSAVLRHVVMHTSQRPYQCTACDMTFRTHKTSRDHCVDVHGTRFIKVRKVESEELRQAEGYAVKIQPEKDAKPRYERFKKSTD